jgi:protein gp37
MQKSKIEWCDYTINPVKGLCPMACPYCYARAMYKRFKWNPEIRFDWSVYNDLPKIKKPSRIFWGSTMELFGEWVESEWMRLIFEAVKAFPQHTHIFLTKRPLRLKKFSPFPDNAWVGVSTTGNDSRSYLEENFSNIQAKVKFVSIEPLLGYTPMDFRWVNWIIIGQQTPERFKTFPHMQWVRDIVKDADNEKVSIFIKDNMKELIFTAGIKYKSLDWALDNHGKLRQELPK